MTRSRMLSPYQRLAGSPKLMTLDLKSPSEQIDSSFLIFF
jgi:hypothetical protein